MKAGVGRLGQDAKVEAGRERWGPGHVDGGRDAKVGAGAHGRRAGCTGGGRCASVGMGT